jgi:hypothetical protein
MTLSIVKEALLALRPERLRIPNLPMATALQEAHDLLRLCQRESIRERLVAVGAPADFKAQLELRISAAREAQSDWVAVRDRSKSSSLVELEERAVALRSELIAAGRFNLRGREGQSTLTQIRGGEGVADLVQDLFDLAVLLEKNADAFARDQSFDVAARVTEARSLGDALSAGVSQQRLGPEPGSARDLRDRAFTYLDDLVVEVRAAGRYAFRLEPQQAKAFTSRHRRRARTKAGDAGEGETSEEVVEEEVVGDPTIAAE